MGKKITKEDIRMVELLLYIDILLTIIAMFSTMEDL